MIQPEYFWGTSGALLLPSPSPPQPGSGTFLPFPWHVCSFPLPFLPAWDLESLHREMGVTSGSVRYKSRESSALPAFTVWGLDKSSELSVSKGELFIRHG